METIHLSLFLMLCLGVHRSSPEILKQQNWANFFNIDEGYKGNYPYTLGQIPFEKKSMFFKIYGQGVDEDPKGILKIDGNTGVLTVHGPVDHEQFRVLKLTFQATDRTNCSVNTRLGIEILITDANDSPPKFDRKLYEIRIKEFTLQGTALTSIFASDADSTENNRLFDFKIISVTPQPHDLEFYLTQNSQTGTISFKGCLDHEKADKYTIIVEAKDRGDEIQLSGCSTIIIHIEDGNNHLPKFIGQTGPGRVKEGQENVLVSCLQVKDEDSKGTAAWRAKYQIHGDTNNHFRITTDAETNEGLLYVEKHLDYEESPQKKLSISVENMIPYQVCKVVSRRTTGLWRIVTISSVTRSFRLSIRQVIVIVEDVNEPPIFTKYLKQVTVVENVKVGHYLVTFTAKDPDIASNNTIVYRKGHDPANWVTVDINIGKITTSNLIDRESPFVKGNIYTVTILAVDNGQPPMTGTATLIIHIIDVNDNRPTLPVTTIHMCQSDRRSLANITAVDPDEDPYGGPFTFKLLGNMEGKWKLDPKQGYSVNLVKENTVHSGHHKLVLEVSDRGGMTAVHNLSVTVCNCVDAARPYCNSKATGSVSRAGLGIIFFGMLLLAGLLLLAFLLSCKRESKPIPVGDSEQHLMNCNTEKPGTDGKEALEQLNKEYTVKEEKMSHVPSVKQSTAAAVSNAQSQYSASQAEILKQRLDYLNLVTTDSTMKQNFSQGNSMHRSMGASSAMRRRLQHRHSMRGTWSGHSRFSAYHQYGVMRRSALFNVLKKKLHTLEAPGEELGDYAPHVYAEEGDTKETFELDAISIPDISFDPDVDLDLDSTFNTLASICMPSESTAHRTEQQTTTLIQNEHHRY